MVEGFVCFDSLVCEWVIFLVEYWGIEVILSVDNFLFVGVDFSVWFVDVDVILVVDLQVLWMIVEGDCCQDCIVIQMGFDLFFFCYLVCGYCVDINLVGEIDEVFSLLEEVLCLLQVVCQQYVVEWVVYMQSCIQ